MSKAYQIVSLDETYVAGLAFRTKNEQEADPQTGWIAKTWERVRKINSPNQPAAILTDYESDKDGYYTEIVGFMHDSPNDLKPGEVLTKVPSGQYAKFIKQGPMPMVVIEAWQAVWQAEEDGVLKRAYTSDLETYPKMESVNKGTVVLYIAIK